MSDLLPKMDTTPKRVPSEHAPAAASYGSVPKAVQETALQLIEEALADTDARSQKIRRKVDRGGLSIPAVYEAFKVFEKAIGGRQKLIETLKYCPEGSVGSALVHKLLEDPDFITASSKAGNGENVKFSLGVLAQKHKLPFNAMVAAFRDAKTAQIAIETLNQIAPHAPTVVEQVVEDAQNRYVPCIVCEGSARVPRIGENGEWLLDADGIAQTQLCYECRGTGKVWQKHDIQNRKMFLQMTKLIEKEGKGESTVNVNLQQAHLFGGNFLPGDGSFEKIIKSINLAPTGSTTTEVVDVPFTVYEETSNPE